MSFKSVGNGLDLLTPLEGFRDELYTVWSRGNTDLVVFCNWGAFASSGTGVMGLVGA